MCLPESLCPLVVPKGSSLVPVWARLGYREGENSCSASPVLWRCSGKSCVWDLRDLRSITQLPSTTTSGHVQIHSEEIVNFKKNSNNLPWSLMAWAVGGHCLSSLFWAWNGGQILPPLECSSPGTQKGSQGWNFDLVSHRKLGTQAAPGLGSAIIYSCALRQSTIRKKTRTKEEQQHGEKNQ